MGTNYTRTFDVDIPDPVISRPVIAVEVGWVRKTASVPPGKSMWVTDDGSTFNDEAAVTSHLITSAQNDYVWGIIYDTFRAIHGSTHDA